MILPVLCYGKSNIFCGDTLLIFLNFEREPTTDSTQPKWILFALYTVSMKTAPPLYTNGKNIGFVTE